MSLNSMCKFDASICKALGCHVHPWCMRARVPASTKIRKSPATVSGYSVGTGYQIQRNKLIHTIYEAKRFESTPFFVLRVCTSCLTRSRLRQNGSAAYDNFRTIARLWWDRQASGESQLAAAHLNAVTGPLIFCSCVHPLAECKD
jgi:hypothetical protein